MDKYFFRFTNLLDIDFREGREDVGDRVEEWYMKVKWSGLYKRDDQGKDWWNLRACVYYSEFEKEKVVWQEIAQKPTFSYDTQWVFCNDTGRILTGENIKFFVWLLNSQFFKYIFPSYYAGGWLWEKWIRYKSEFMKDFPIPPISSSNQSIISQIEWLVDDILDMKKWDSKSDTSDLENQIDELVYRLYDLTSEEIGVVDPKRLPIM